MKTISGNAYTKLCAGYPTLLSVPSSAISANLTWLKLLALAAMLFDHMVVGYLQTHGESVTNSFLRLPGRLSIPIFSFLIAYSYAHYTSNKNRQLVRLWLFAAISEPIYRAYFGEFGNALIALALGVTFLLMQEKMCGLYRRLSLLAFFCVAALAFALVTKSILMLTIPALVWLFYLYGKNKNAVWLIPIVAMGTLSNHIGWGELAMLSITLGLILLLSNIDVKLPPVHLNKWVGYVFYPLHLLVLYTVKCFFF